MPQLDSETRRHGTMTGIELIAEWHLALGFFANNSFLACRRQFGCSLDKLETSSTKSEEKPDQAGRADISQRLRADDKEILSESDRSSSPAEAKRKGFGAKAARLVGSLHRRTTSKSERSVSRKRNKSKTRKTTPKEAERVIAEVEEPALAPAQQTDTEPYEYQALVEHVNKSAAARLLFNIGILKALHGEHGEAAMWLRRATKNDTDMVIAWYALGIALFEIGHLKASMISFNIGRQITRDFVEDVGRAPKIEKQKKDTAAEHGAEDLIQNPGSKDKLGGPETRLEEYELPPGWWKIEVVRWDGVIAEEMFLRGQRRFGREFFKLNRSLMEWNFEIAQDRYRVLKMKKEWEERIPLLSKSCSEQDRIQKPNHLQVEAKERTEAELRILEARKARYEERLSRGTTDIWNCPYPLSGLDVGTLLPPPVELGLMYSDHLPPTRLPREKHESPEEEVREQVVVDDHDDALDDAAAAFHPSALPSPLAISRVISPSGKQSPPSYSRRPESLLVELNKSFTLADSPPPGGYTSDASSETGPSSAPRGRSHRRNRSTLSQAILASDTEPTASEPAAPSPLRPGTPSGPEMAHLDDIPPIFLPSVLSPASGITLTPGSRTAPLPRDRQIDPLSGPIRRRAATQHVHFPYARHGNWRSRAPTPTTNEGGVFSILELYFRPDLDSLVESSDEGEGRDLVHPPMPRTYWLGQNRDSDKSPDESGSPTMVITPNPHDDVFSGGGPVSREGFRLRMEEIRGALRESPEEGGFVLPAVSYDHER